MRVYLISIECGEPKEFQDKTNSRIESLESEGARIVDVKFSVDLSNPAHLCALILWEPKDV